MPKLEENFFEVLRQYTAGDPMREEVQWTNLTQKEIAERDKSKGSGLVVFGSSHS